MGVLLGVDVRVIRLGRKVRVVHVWPGVEWIESACATALDSTPCEVRSYVNWLNAMGERLVRHGIYLLAYSELI